MSTKNTLGKGEAWILLFEVLVSSTNVNGCKNDAQMM